MSYFEWVQNLQHFRWDEDAGERAARRDHAHAPSRRWPTGPSRTALRCGPRPTSWASNELSRQRPLAATSSTSVQFDRHLSSDPKSLSSSTLAMPKDEIRRHGGFRRTKRHGTPLSCTKRGVAGAGDSPPQLSLAQSKSKSRGGFCSNQSRSCSGVSWRKSGVSSSTSGSSSSSSTASSTSSLLARRSSAVRSSSTAGSRAARCRSSPGAVSAGRLGRRRLLEAAAASGERLVRLRLGVATAVLGLRRWSAGSMLLRRRGAQAARRRTARLVVRARSGLLGGNRGGSLVGRDLGILGLLRHLAPGRPERLFLLALDLFLGHSVLALQLEMLPDGIVEYAHRRGTLSRRRRMAQA